LAGDGRGSIQGSGSSALCAELSLDGELTGGGPTRLSGDGRAVRAGVREQPTRPEREMVGLLKELGAEEGRDYQREYKVSPGMYADFAIPERKLAIEVHGGAHQATFFLEKGMEAREAQRAETYEREGWTVHIVTDRDLREGRAGTRARMHDAITGAAGGGR
jgi:very-short-patch-repair endonuclease